MSATPVRSSRRLSSAAGTPTQALRSSPSDTPTRKVPHCRTCGRPRAGHPRQGCQTNNSDASAELENRLQSLQLEVLADSNSNSPRSRRRSSPKKPKLETSLASLSSSTNEILDGLLEPGMMDDAVGAKDTTIECTPTNQRTRGPRAVMPGSLVPPTHSQNSSFAFEEPTPATLALSSPPVIPLTTKPLMRSLSMEEREVFLSSLMERSKAPPATVVSLPLDDVPSTQAAASKIGFHTRVLCPVKDAGGERWLVIGRDHGAVEKLYASTRDRVQDSGSRGIPLAAGAVMGAVGAVASLAFS